jgi:hypothetical protein
VVPDHVPGCAVTGLPASAVPAMNGAAVFCGAVPAISPLAGPSDSLVPALFVAVTRGRTVPPTSGLCSVYVFWSAPPIGAQFEPATLQRSHRYA